MPPTLDEVIRLTYDAISKMDSWMRVLPIRGFDGFSEEDRRSFANRVGVNLFQGTCSCGLEICPARHDVAAFPESGIHELWLFVEQAVVGPLEFKANSLAQGMFYRLILLPECQMRVAPVELKCCQVCGDLYEEWNCVRVNATETVTPAGTKVLEQPRRCTGSFTPSDTEVVGQTRLIVEGVYLAVQRWSCGPEKKKHFYQQQNCRSVLNPDTEKYVTPHSSSSGHDKCPWTRCPHGNPEHGQNPTSLWIRRELLGDAAANYDRDPPNRSAAIATGFRKAIRKMKSGLWDRLRTAIQQEANLQIAKDGLDALRSFAEGTKPLESPRNEDLVAIVDWLFQNEKNPLSRNDRKAIQAAVRDAIWQELQNYGIDL